MRRVLAAAVVCLLSVPATFGASDVDALLRRHAAWLGGDRALARLRDLTWSGQITAAGFDGTLTLHETRSGWRRHDMVLGPLSTTDVVGPGGGWVLNWTGQVEPMSAAKIETERAEAIRSFARHLLEPAAAERRDLGTEERDGQSWRVLRFTFASGDYVDLFLNPDGSCTWTRERRDTDTFWTRLDDWRLVSNVRMPFAQQTFHDDHTLDTKIQWTNVTVNKRVAADTFARPSPRASAAIAGGAAATARIPIQLVEGRYIYLDGTVNGRITPILLDSGAANTVLSAAFAATLDIKSAGALHIRGTTSAQQAMIATGVDVAIDTARLSNLTVVITDLASVEQAMGRPVPIILGKEAFNAFAVEIDYPASTVAFHSADAFRPASSARPLRLMPGDAGIRLVEARVEGLPPALFVLDTGSGSSVALFKSFIEAHQLLDRRPVRSQRLSRGVGGGSVVTIATLASFSLAGFELRDVPADFHLDERGAFNTVRAAGNLGAGVLQRFRVVLHYRDNTMYLEPTKGWDRAFCKDRSGIQADYHDGVLEVVFVAPGSPAAKAGCHAGDRITAINHQPIGSDYPLKPVEWSCGAAGSSVVLTDAAHVDRPLVLADYY